MTENWTIEQTRRSIAQFERLMADAYPETNEFLGNARAYLQRVGGDCNYLAAIEQVPWETYLAAGTQVLDLGCGGGWLAAWLSRKDAVDTVYALDSSRYFIETVMPQVVELMQGRPDKIVGIEGLFEPLLFEDAAPDAIVESSAVHHAENLESVLREARRVLKPGGVLFALNETPWPGYRHLISVAAAAARIVRDLTICRYRHVSPAISSSGYLYDPNLGDRDYPRWYWERAFAAAGFSVEAVIDTGLPTQKGSKGRSLVHFVCRAV